MAKKLGRGMDALLKKETTSLGQPLEETKRAVVPKTKKKTGEAGDKKQSGRAIVVDTAIIDEEKITADSAHSIQFLSIENIMPNEEQPRKYFNEEKITELAQSITRQGILQPLLVVRRGENFSIVAGERRFRAAVLAHQKTVPVIVLSLNEEEIFETALVENLQRENLNPIETALSFQNLLRIKNMTHLELSQQLGVSRAVITNALRLLNLPRNIQQALEQNHISSSHARELVSLKTEAQQQKAFTAITKHNISVHELSKTRKQKKSESENNPTAHSKPRKKADAHFSNYQNALIEHFGTNVTLSGSFSSGSIKIDFYGTDDFERIIRLCGLKNAE